MTLTTFNNNIIQSAINLIEEIHRNYDEETSGDLERRIINSIKHRDSRKFARGIDRINEDLYLLIDMGKIEPLKNKIKNEKTKKQQWIRLNSTPEEEHP